MKSFPTDNKNSPGPEFNSPTLWLGFSEQEKFGFHGFGWQRVLYQGSGVLADQRGTESRTGMGHSTRYIREQSGDKTALQAEQHQEISKIHLSVYRNLLLVASCSVRPDRIQTCSSSKFGHHLECKNMRQQEINIPQQKYSLCSPEQKV